MFDSTIVRAHVSAAGAKGGRAAKRWAARAAASRPRSTSRTYWDGDPLGFCLTGGEASEQPPLTSRRCSILAPTSRRALRWVTKAMTPRRRNLGRPPAPAASARLFHIARRPKRSRRSSPRRSTVDGLASSKPWESSNASSALLYGARKPTETDASFVALALSFILPDLLHTT